MKSPSPIGLRTSVQQILTLLTIGIAVVIGVGILPLVPNPFTFVWFALFSPTVLALLVAVVLAHFIGSRALESIRAADLKDQSPYVVFLYATALYILGVTVVLTLTQVCLNLLLGNVPQDSELITQLFVSGSFIGSILVFYVGLVRYMVVLCSLLKDKTTSHASNLPIGVKIRIYSVIAIALLVLLYGLNAMTLVAQLSRNSSLCTLLHGQRARAECFANISIAKGVEESGFIVVSTPYKNIRDLREVGGKIAYIATKESSEVVVHGEVAGPEYTRVTDIIDIGGKVAYRGCKDCNRTIYEGTDLTSWGGTQSGKWVAVYDGRELGDEYDSVTKLIDVAGRPAFIGERKDGGSVVVMDGTEYGKEFTSVRSIQAIDGKLAFLGKYSGEQSSPEAVVLDTKVIFGPADIGMLLVGKGNLVVVMHGVEQIVYRGVYASTDPFNPFNNTKNGVVENPIDGSYELYLDSVPTGIIYPEVGNAAVSKEGRVAVLLNDVVYLDGERITTEAAGPPLEFYGETLLFREDSDDGSYLNYGGKKVGRGFSVINYRAMAGGKLHLSALKDRKAYLLIEP